MTTAITGILTQVSGVVTFMENNTYMVYFLAAPILGLGVSFLKRMFGSV